MSALAIEASEEVETAEVEASAGDEDNALTNKAVVAIEAEAETETETETTDAEELPRNFAIAGMGSGGDTDGAEYESLASMWNTELGNDGSKAGEWYDKAAAWWADEKNCPATIDGVLGGFGFLDYVDIDESTKFLLEILLMEQTGSNNRMGRQRALDCGAGIGRITKHLLRKFFGITDLVEGNQRLLDEVPRFMASGAKVSNYKGDVGELFCCTLQDCEPKEAFYDCIWVQWVVIYLTDRDFISFLQRCARGLRPGGMIIIKENILSLSSEDDFLVDKDDSSLTRSKAYMERIFEKAGMVIVRDTRQKNFPEDMFPVWTWALQPRKT